MPRQMVPDCNRSTIKVFLQLNRIIYYNKICSYLHLKNKNFKNISKINDTKENSFWLIQNSSHMQAERKHK